MVSDFSSGENWRMADAFFEASGELFSRHEIITEALKLRIANGIHTAMVYVPWLRLIIWNCWCIVFSLKMRMWVKRPWKTVKLLGPSICLSLSHIRISQGRCSLEMSNRKWNALLLRCQLSVKFLPDNLMAGASWGMRKWILIILRGRLVIVPGSFPHFLNNPGRGSTINKVITVQMYKMYSHPKGVRDCCVTRTLRSLVSFTHPRWDCQTVANFFLRIFMQICKSWKNFKKVSDLWVYPVTCLISFDHLAIYIAKVSCFCLVLSMHHKNKQNSSSERLPTTEASWRKARNPNQRNQRSIEKYLEYWLADFLEISKYCHRFCPSRDYINLYKLILRTHICDIMWLL